MTLSRRYIRNIRENLSFYISSTVLTVLTLLMFFLYEISGSAILNFSQDFYASQAREDANFTTYLPIPDEDIPKLEDEFDLELESQRYINIETDGVTARVFSPTEKIDRYAVTQGNDVKKPGDLILSEGYAVKNEVSIGDTITIGDKDYTVTGFFQRPDYLYMLENTEDSYKNITTFFLCYMTPEDFDALGDTSCQYLVRYHGDSDAFRTAIYDRYVTASYLSAQDNPRISMVEMQAKMFLIMAYILLVTLPLVAVALIAIIISRKVKSEQKLIGTLSALGYQKGRLMRHYAGFAALPGLLGGVLTAVIAAIVAQPYGELGLQDYEPMRIHCTMNPIATVLGILIPTAMYILAALLAVRRLLRHDTVSLLAGSVGNDKKHRRLLANSHVSVRLKFALRTLLGSPARSFVILLGIFLGSYIALLGFSMVDTINGMVDITSDSVGTYSYEYILNDLSGENDYGGEPMLMTSMESESERALSLIGTRQDNPYLNLTTDDGNTAKLGTGCYITSLTALLEDWQTGDTVTLYNPLSTEKTTLHIDGIVTNDVQQAAYVTRDKAAEIMGVDKSAFNVLLGAKTLDIPGDKVVREIRKSAFAEQIRTMTDQMGVLIDLLIGLGFVICIAAIYVAINMLVTENRNNISMLKVLGYRNRRIDGMVLSSSHILLPLGILLSIPAAYGSMEAFTRMFADMDGMLMTVSIRPKSYLLTILLTCLSYFGSLLVLRRKITRVNMIESLKDNRE